MIHPISPEEQTLQETHVQEYDHFQRPPNLQIAIKHGKASRFAQADPNVDIDQTNSCPCCGMPTILIELPITASIKDFSFNGPGVSLYFDFFRYSIAFLAVFILVSGLYNIIISINGNNCMQLSNSKYDCVLNFYNLYSKSNADFYNLDYLGSALNFLCTLIIIVGLFFYRRHINKLVNLIDERSILVSDYSITVENIPRDAKEEEIKQFFSKIGDKELEIKKICLGYQIQEYLNLEQSKIQKEKELTKYLELERKQQKQQKQMDQSQQQKDTLISEIKQISDTLDKFEENFSSSFEFSGFAVISYNYEREANYVCQFFKTTRIQILLEQFTSLFGKKNQKYFRGNLVLVQKAPEPGDILWKNLGITIWGQYKRVLITNIVSIFLLGICFGIIFGLSYGQFTINTKDNNQQTSTTEALAITILGVIASVLISVINNVLAYIIKKLAEMESHPTLTEYNVSLAKKLGFAQFLNTAIITLIVNLVIVEAGEPSIVSVVKSGGLNADVMLIYITNGITPWLMIIIDFGYLWKLYLRYQIRSQGQQCLMTQQQANEAFEGPAFDLSKKYAQLAKTVMFTLFYAYLLPLGTVLSCGSLIIVYAVEKILIVKRNSKPPPTGSEMIEEMVDFYGELVLLVFSSGCCVWESILYNKIFGLTWAMLGISIANFLFPFGYLFDYFFKVQDQDTPESYESQQLTFWDDYDRRNPVTAEKAIEDWKKLQEQTVTVAPGQKNQAIQRFETQLRREQSKKHPKKQKTGQKRKDD